MPLTSHRTVEDDELANQEVANPNLQPPAQPRAGGYKLGSVGTIFASGSAMFSDGYSNASIGPVNTILAIVLGDAFTKHDKAVLSAMAFAGMVAGQLSFGYVSDKIGRKIAMFICTAIIFVFSILSSASSGSPQTIVKCLIAFRFLLGVGLGGEYPAGSVTAAEATENNDIKKGRQQRLFIWATNMMLDFAFGIAWFVALVLLWIFGMNHLRVVWRGTLALGAIPPLILLVARLFMEEPQAYKKNSMKHAPIPYLLLIKRYWLKLLAVSITWFIYDWITYPFGMYSSTITDMAAPNSTLYETLGWGCLINAFYIPGSMLGSFVSDWIGPKYAMITGLLLQAIFGFAMSGAYNQLTNNGSIAGFAVMYGIFLACGELGPGNNLGLLASKVVGPTAARGQLYGVAAAVGKIGAFIGNYTFPYMITSFSNRSEYLGNTGIIWVGSALAIFSAIITFFFIPNIGPDYMVREDEEFREYLAAHGYDVSQIGEAGYKAHDEIPYDPELGHTRSDGSDEKHHEN